MTRLDVRATLRTHPAIDDTWDRSDALRRGYWIAVCLALLMATVFLASDDARLSSIGFSTIRATGGRWVWGALFALLAVTLLAARSFRPVVLRATLWAAATVYVLLAVSFFTAAVEHPMAALTGWPIYLSTAATHVSQTFSYREGGTRHAAPPGAA